MNVCTPGKSFFFNISVVGWTYISKGTFCVGLRRNKKSTHTLDEKVFMDSEHMRERTDPTREQLLEPVLCCQYLRY